jgi:hypothetical protein
MQNVVCCEHTRVRCVAITWAHCTRVASVRASEVSHSDTGPTMSVVCVCAVYARLSRRPASQVRACARRKSAIDPADYGSCRGIQ